jgi:hypothetical protein
MKPKETLTKERGKQRKTTMALQVRKDSRRPRKTTSMLQQQSISLGIRINPDTAKISNHPIPTLRITLEMAYIGSRTCNLHHPTVTLALINYPSRPNLIVRIVSYPQICQFSPISWLSRQRSRIHTCKYTRSSTAQDQTPDLCIQRFSQWDYLAAHFCDSAVISEC